MRKVADAYQPAWSPDGRHLAFSVSRDGRFADLFVWTVESGNLRRLIRSPGMDVWPTWSPDGRKIAFTRDLGWTGDTYTVSDVYMVDVATRKVTRLTDDPELDMQPAWRPAEESS